MKRACSLNTSREEILAYGSIRSIKTVDSRKVIVGTGKICHEEGGEWCRDSLPISLSNSYIDQGKNGVATFLLPPLEMIRFNDFKR